MSERSNMRTGGQILIDQLRIHGADTAFCVPGESYLAELVAPAFTLATSGRPGPVALAFPEDMLREPASVADADPYKTIQAHPSDADMERLREMLAAAKKPVMLLGGSTWNAQAVRDITAFAEANRVATAGSFPPQGPIAHPPPCFARDPGAAPNPKARPPL